MVPTDEALAVAALAGAEEAFGELVRRYERPLFTLVLRMVRDRSLAEDLAQDAFVKAFEKLASFDAERKFSSWLFKIAHNTTIDHLRRRSLPTLSLDEPLGDDADAPQREIEDREGEAPSRRVEQADLAAVLSAALGELRPEYRQVILLRFQAGMEYAEIAETTGLPLGTVKTYLFRARKELAELLAGSGYEGVS